MFYAASVMKLGILLAYFETHPEQVDNLPPEIQADLERMIKVDMREQVVDVPPQQEIRA